jgi:hypothetical protein
MTTPSQAYTVAYPFFRSSERKPYLFQVNPGVDAREALDQASSMLYAAYDLAFGVAMESSSESSWSIVRLIEMANAVVESVSEGLPERNEP